MNARENDLSLRNRIKAKLDEMKLDAPLLDRADEGYMAAVYELLGWLDTT